MISYRTSYKVAFGCVALKKIPMINITKNEMKKVDVINNSVQVGL